MSRARHVAATTLLVTATLLVVLLSSGRVAAQARGQSANETGARRASAAEARLTGVFQFDPLASDKLYTVVANATTDLPQSSQQQFLDDLTVRLSSPDQIAIERRGSRVSIASSRAPRVTVFADGGERIERGTAGRIIHTRAGIEGEQLVITTGGSGVDPFYVSFQPLDEGRRMLVTRRIHAEQLNQPLVVKSIYNKVSDDARWGIYGAPPIESREPPQSSVTASSAATRTEAARTENDQATLLRSRLGAWIKATNDRSISRQMTFYMPRLEAFYLARNVSSEAVRREKERIFSRAKAVDIRAAEPEIIFRDGANTAVMRFRKQYAIEDDRRKRSGEVVQELRWRLMNGDWKIYSERDIRVLR